MQTPKLLHILAVASLLPLAMGVASAETTYTGFLIAGQPGTYFNDVGGIVEKAAPCDTSSVLNGLDGHWYDAAGEGGNVTTLTMDATLDADIHWFDANCNYLGSAANYLLGETESGTLHSATAYVLVAGFAGSGHYTLTIA